MTSLLWVFPLGIFHDVSMGSLSTRFSACWR